MNYGFNNVLIYFNMGRMMMNRWKGVQYELYFETDPYRRSDSPLQMHMMQNLQELQGQELLDKSTRMKHGM